MFIQVRGISARSSDAQQPRAHDPTSLRKWHGVELCSLAATRRSFLVQYVRVFEVVDPDSKVETCTLCSFLLSDSDFVL